MQKPKPAKSVNFVTEAEPATIYHKIVRLCKEKPAANSAQVKRCTGIRAQEKAWKQLLDCREKMPGLDELSLVSDQGTDLAEGFDPYNNYQIAKSR